MKRNYIKFSAVLFTILLLVACFGSPIVVSAAGVDYKDYISNIEVDGHNDIVTITIPANEQYWIYQDETAGTPPIKSEQGWLDFTGTPMDESDPLGDYHIYTIQLHPFNGRLNLDDIPNNTKYSTGFKFHYNWGSGYETPYVSCNEQYYSSSGHWLGQIQNNVGRVPFDNNAVYETSGILDKDGPFSNGVTTPAGSVDLFLQLYEFSPLNGSHLYFEAQDFTMTFTISSLYELQQTQEKTNELLEAVEVKLEANGQKLDDIINGTPEQNESANNAADVLGNKGEQLGNLAGDIQPDKPDLDSVDTNVDKLVPSVGLTTLTGAISPIANNELVIKILVMVATLILVSYVLFGKKG